MIASLAALAAGTSAAAPGSLTVLVINSPSGTVPLDSEEAAEPVAPSHSACTPARGAGGCSCSERPISRSSRCRRSTETSTGKWTLWGSTPGSSTARTLAPGPLWTTSEPSEATIENRFSKSQPTPPQVRSRSSTQLAAKATIDAASTCWPLASAATAEPLVMSFHASAEPLASRMQRGTPSLLKIAARQTPGWLVTESRTSLIMPHPPSPSRSRGRT